MTEFLEHSPGNYEVIADVHAACKERAAKRDEMFKRQAAAVRHHTDRADELERRAAELPRRREGRLMEHSAKSGRAEAKQAADCRCAALLPALRRWIAACDAFDDAKSGSWGQHEAWMEACGAELAVKTLARTALLGGGE